MKAKNYLLIITAILLLADLVILLNIRFLRQILGFLFLTMLPGLLVLQILKLNKIGSTEKFVLSVGLSISFIMFFGLLINNVSLNFGYETPLATIFILISFNIAFIVLAIIGYKINKELTFPMPNLNLSTSEKAFLIVPVLFPALSIFGMHIMNTTDNNIILMLLLFLIPAYVVFVCFFNQKFSERLYPVVIFSISMSLLLISMLRFPHIWGHDVHTEYYIFQTTFDNLYWGVIEHSALDACLSISLLPTIFQSIMNINAQEYLFKGVYVGICSFGPLAVYVIAKRYIDELYAFLASFFFISQTSFLQVPGSPRTNIAIFFVALALMVLFNDKIEPLKKRILLIVFIFSVVVSHYSTAYIFFFVIVGTFIGTEILLKKYTFKKVISLTFTLIFFALIFFWYSQVTETAFNAGVAFVENTLVNLNEFFLEESRSEQLKPLVGQGLAYPILSKANLVVTWCTFILIGIGVVTIAKRYKEMIAISNIKHKNPDFLKTKFEMEYLVMALTCAGLLVIMVAIPYVSVGYGLQRLYSLVIVILSVCFVIGGITLSHFLSKERTCAKKETLFAKQKAFTEKCYHSSFGKAFLSKKRFVLKEKQESLTKNATQNPQVRAYLIILLILIPYSMFVTGAMYQIFGAPVASTLNSEIEACDLESIHDSESYAAKWLAGNIKKRDMISVTDGYARHGLISQGKIPKTLVNTWMFSKHKKQEGWYIYLSYYNVVKGKLMVGGMPCNMTEYSDMFTGESKIYDNNCAEIYK